MEADSCAIAAEFPKSVTFRMAQVAEAAIAIATLVLIARILCHRSARSLAIHINLKVIVP